MTAREHMTLEHITHLFNRMDVMAEDITNGILDPNTLEEYCVCHSFLEWKLLYQQEATQHEMPCPTPVQWLSIQHYLVTQVILRKGRLFCGRDS